MDILNFLPKYPNIDNFNDEYDVLNPYEDDFYESIFKKKEFYDERIIKDDLEQIPDEKGMLLKHQKIVARFLSSNTMYDSLLLVHSPGSGKTCGAIGAIEQIKNERGVGFNGSNFRGAYIFAKGKAMLNNFVKELRDKCTAGQYIPEGKLTDLELVVRTKKLYEDFYHFSIGNNKPTTFETFAKHLRRLRDSDIVSMYSNYILVIDEVHNLRIQDDEGGGLYEQFKRFLRLVKNCKILLLSGTPMKDSADEIASVMNLILQEKDELPTGKKFLELYMDKSGDNLYEVKENKIDELKSKFKGRVSFVKSIESSVKKKFVGKDNMGKLTKFVVYPVNMSKFQTKVYMTAVESDTKGQQGVFTSCRQASLFIFPDGKYGSDGFSRHVIKKADSRAFLASTVDDKKVKPLYSYSLSPYVISKIKGENNDETLHNLSKYSCKYTEVIKKILDNPKKCCFVYSELVTGSGSIVFAEILKLFGFSQSNGLDKKVGLRFGLLTSETSSSKKISNVINCFNQETNKYGEIIRVLIGSRVVSEGVSFSNIQQEFILTPWFNYSETEQAIARGHRLGSHRDLLKVGEIPVVSIYQLVAMPRSEVLSIDLHMYEMSEDKDVSIKGVMRLLMESAFDCSLIYYRNHISGSKDGDRDCEYKKCDYICDGVDMQYIDKEIADVDNSTYQLYYANPHVNGLKLKLTKLFKKYDNLSLEKIVKNLDGEYGEYEIKNALSHIITKSKDGILYYKDYIGSSMNGVNKIMLNIEDLFKVYFSLHFNEIFTLLQDGSQLTEFDVLTGLKNMIDESVIVINMYGFSSYIRESNNVYFLVNSLSVYDKNSVYYSEVPNILDTKVFSDVLYDVQMELLPDFIDVMCKLKTFKSFSKLIKTIPEDIQEMLIESAILSQENGVVNTPIRTFILDYFKNYIHFIDGVWFSNRIEDEDVIRCYNKEPGHSQSEWVDCDDTFRSKLDIFLRSRKMGLEQNPWGYYGKYNPENGVFALVNVIAQQEKYKNDKLKEENRLDQLVKNEEITQDDKDFEMEKYQPDSRNSYPGLRCLSWTVAKLLNIGIKILKLDYPETFEPTLTKTELQTKVRINTNLTDIYTLDEINDLTEDELRRSLFYVSKKSKRKHLCDSIKEWMDKKEWNGIPMLITDSEAGVQGGHLKKDKTKITDTVTSEKSFRIEVIKSKDIQSKFKQYSNYIKKLMLKCFNINNYKIDNNNLLSWVMIFNKRKLIGFITLDKLDKNKISSICISLSKKKLFKKALIDAFDYLDVVNPRIIVDNKDKRSIKLIRLYISYGFTIIKNDIDNTTMQFLT